MALWIFYTAVPIALWLGHASYAAYLSGWRELVRRYPDHCEKPIAKIGASGGTVSRGTDLKLKFDVCSSGLRVSAGRYYIFSRSFFVPWANISVVRIPSRVSLEKARLVFGVPEIAWIIVDGTVADQIGRFIPAQWPEGSIPNETRVAVNTRFARACLGVAFVFVVLMIGNVIGPSDDYDHIFLIGSFGFVGLVLAWTVFQYWREIKRIPNGHRRV